MLPLVAARAPRNTLLRSDTPVPLDPYSLPSLLVRRAPGVVRVSDGAPRLGVAGRIARVVLDTAVFPGPLAAAAVGRCGAFLRVSFVRESRALLVLRLCTFIPSTTVQLKPLPRARGRLTSMLCIAPSLAVGIRCDSTAIVSLPLVEPPILAQAPTFTLLGLDAPIEKLRGTRGLLLDRPEAPNVFMHCTIRDDTFRDGVASATPLVDTIFLPLTLAPAVAERRWGVWRWIVGHLRAIRILDLHVRTEIPEAFMLVLGQAGSKAIFPSRHVAPLSPTFGCFLASIQDLTLVTPVVETGAPLHGGLRGCALVPCLVRFPAHRAVSRARNGIRNGAPSWPPCLRGALVVLQPIVAPITHAVAAILSLRH
mmetsp:Transcript_4794/g.10315  ORF Transcript_4794/g.10315 Transcript_4794/m.10315 type:complete len:367 (-) Transcript_4794:3224-4324(-)